MADSDDGTSQRSGVSQPDGDPLGRFVRQSGSESSGDEGEASGASDDGGVMRRIARDLATVLRSRRKQDSYYLRVVKATARRVAREAPAGLPIDGKPVIFQVPATQMPDGQMPRSPVLAQILQHIYSVLYFIERDVDVVTRIATSGEAAASAAEVQLFAIEALQTHRAELLDMYSYLKDALSEKQAARTRARMRQSLAAPLPFDGDTERDRRLAQLLRKSAEATIKRLVKAEASGAEGRADRGRGHAEGRPERHAGAPTAWGQPGRAGFKGKSFKKQPQGAAGDGAAPAAPK